MPTDKFAVREPKPARNLRRRPGKCSSGGFTLIEVLISLIIGVLIVGGVMGVISAAMQLTERIQEKNRVQAVLESAAQEILLSPGKALDGSLTLEGLSEKPTVVIESSVVLDPSGNEIGIRSSRLHRVKLKYQGSMFEFSILVPEHGTL